MELDFLRKLSGNTHVDRYAKYVLTYSGALAREARLRSTMGK